MFWRMRKSLAAFAISWLMASVAFGQSGVLVLRGARIHPVSGPVIERGGLIVENGKITAVGAMRAVPIPANAMVEDATGKVIIPALVDTHSHIGIGPRPPVAAN